METLSWLTYKCITSRKPAIAETWYFSNVLAFLKFFSPMAFQPYWIELEQINFTEPSTNQLDTPCVIKKLQNSFFWCLMKITNIMFFGKIHVKLTYLPIVIIINNLMDWFGSTRFFVLPLQVHFTYLMNI